MKIIQSVFLLWALATTSVLGSETSASIVEKLNSFSQMREELAKSLSKPWSEVTENDFKAVCAPVGMAFKKWAETNGFQARQVSAKARNPKNLPTKFEQAISKQFERNPKLEHIESDFALNGHKGPSIAVRIRVAEACLKCHGKKAERPEYIVQKYPNDRAFNFKVGDLRGFYWVWKSKGN